MSDEILTESEKQAIAANAVNAWDKERESSFAAPSGSATYDTEHRDNIVCPHCGYEDRDSWEVDFGPGLEGETEHQCADCGQTMKAERCCTVTYTTAKTPNTGPGPVRQ